jgi:branched-chain amino acid transport system permease protein
MTEFIQILLNGMSLGSIYAIVALGFVLIYKATDVFNFAQGELMMVGAYVCYTLMVHLELSYWLSFLLTFCFCFVFGMAIEILILRPLLGKPIFSVIMVTVGLAVILQGTVSLIWGDDVYNFPKFFSDKALRFPGISLRPTDIWVFVTTFFLVIGFYMFFRRSKLGLAMRGTANNQDIALLMGINVKRVFSLSWAIAACIAAVGGACYANVLFLAPDMSHIGLKAFPAAILGGLDSIPGAIIGGIIIGVCETLAGGYIDQLVGGGVREITSFIILIAILMVKPYGLFGKEKIIRV